MKQVKFTYDIGPSTDEKYKKTLEYNLKDISKQFMKILWDFFESSVTSSDFKITKKYSKHNYLSQTIDIIRFGKARNTIFGDFKKRGNSINHARHARTPRAPTPQVPARLMPTKRNVFCYTRTLALSSALILAVVLFSSLKYPPPNRLLLSSFDSHPSFVDYDVIHVCFFRCKRSPWFWTITTVIQTVISF